MRRVMLFSTLLIGLTGLLAAWQTQIPGVSQTTPAEEDIWKLPTGFQTRHLSKTHTQLRKLNPWGTALQTNTSTQSLIQPQKIPPKWQLVGIIEQGNQRYILLNENNKITQYSLKSSLPNGAQILKIHKDTVEIRQDNQVEVMHLYQ